MSLTKTSWWSALTTLVLAAALAAAGTANAAGVRQFSTQGQLDHPLRASAVTSVAAQSATWLIRVLSTADATSAAVALARSIAPFGKGVLDYETGYWNFRYFSSGSMTDSI